VVAGLVTVVGVLHGLPAFAQVTPAAGYTPPDDTPTVKVGGTIFLDYTYTDEPTTTDADGNVIHPESFNVGRAYVNVTGNLSHRIAFRITPDIARLTGGGTSLDGSLAIRLKYAYGQFNLDEAWSKGSWVRLGQQQTPLVDYLETIYRYRFQGTVFVDREGFLSSSDVGLSTHYNLPKNLGDVHVGYYNGDTYSKAEANDQKAIMGRVSIRPFPTSGALKGLRITAFYDDDHYIKNDARTRLFYGATYEHKYVNAGVEHLDATDQTTAASAELKKTGYSIWATPRFPKGWEGLLRFDHLKREDNDAAKDRKILGVAYWFQFAQGPVAAAILLDYENVEYDALLATQDETRYALHTLFNF
jgi:hypothetical protein